jgi:hypothetical protein
MTRFEPNPGALEHLGEEIASKTNAAVESVARECAGEPVEMIVSRLRRALISIGVEPNERFLRETAERISAATTS